MEKETLVNDYLIKMGIDADTRLTLEEAILVVKTNAPMPYFKYRASKMLPIFFYRHENDFCTAFELATYLAEHFLEMSKRASHAQAFEKKALKEIRQIHFRK